MEQLFIYDVKSYMVYLIVLSLKFISGFGVFETVINATLWWSGNPVISKYYISDSHFISENTNKLHAYICICVLLNCSDKNLSNWLTLKL